VDQTGHLSSAYAPRNKKEVPLVANMTSMSSSAISVGQLISIMVKRQLTPDLFPSSDHTSIVDEAIISLCQSRIGVDSHVNSQPLELGSDRIQILPFLHIRLDRHYLSILVSKLFVCSLAFSFDFG